MTLNGALQVTALAVYPIKSCRGVALPEARIGSYGIEGDRQWMVVDDKGRFLTQRRFPRMALIEPLPANDGLRLTTPGQDPLTVTIPDGNPLPVRIWGFDGTARDAGPQAAAWFSQALSFSCRLVFAGNELQRPVDPDFDSFNSQVAFADAFPFLLLSEASLAGLNSRLAKPVNMDRFRPNIVVSGCPPHAEDDWRELEIGSLGLHAAKLCARCTVPQVDQATGQTGDEPTATLATYRRRDDGEIYFGQNLIHRQKSGVLRVGDSVSVIR